MCEGRVLIFLVISTKEFKKCIKKMHLDALADLVGTFR